MSVSGLFAILYSPGRNWGQSSAKARTPLLSMAVHKLGMSGRICCPKTGGDIEIVWTTEECTSYSRYSRFWTRIPVTAATSTPALTLYPVGRFCFNYLYVLPRQLHASSCFDRDRRFGSSWPRPVGGIQLKPISSHRHGVCQNVDSIPLQCKPARRATSQR